MKKTLHAAVPTTTIIASKTNDPYFVAVFRSSGKHGNKLVLPGGRVKVGKQNWLETGKTEADEELGIKNLTDIKLFCLCCTRWQLPALPQTMWHTQSVALCARAV